jgi:hypothetical protein
MTLAAVGTFPVATFVAGLLVRHLGPTAGTGDKEMLSADKELSRCRA